MMRTLSSSLAAVALLGVAACGGGGDGGSGGSANPTVSATAGGSGGGASGGDAGTVVGSGGVKPKGDAGGACSRGGGGGATGGPADMFPCDSPWYRDVSTAPAYTAEDIVGALGTWGHNNVFAIDFSIVYMHANATTPRINIPLDPSYDPDNDHIAVPVPQGGALEGETGYTCTTGGDCHLIVVDDSTNQLFELWQASNDNGNWRATQESVWDLTKHYGIDGRGKDCTSADAAGFAVLPGLIGVKETVVDHEIKHALRFILPNDHMRPHSYVAPATHSAGHTGSALTPPMGTRMRLKAGFDESQLTSSGAKTVARALKKYGMFLADGGEIALTAEGDQLESVKWGNELAQDDLASIKVSDFEVVELPKVYSYSSLNCVRTP